MLEPFIYPKRGEAVLKIKIAWGDLPDAVRTHYRTSENTEYYILINIFENIPKHTIDQNVFWF